MTTEKTKTLLVMRHAKSSWDNPGYRDVERPLTERGFDDAGLMGKQLAYRKINPEKIYCSIATRTRQTLDVVLKVLHRNVQEVFYETSLYTFNEADLISFIRNLPDDEDHVMMVGHNPACTFLFEKLTGKQLDNLSTAGVFYLRYELDNWSDIMQKKGEILWLGFPREYR